MSAHRANRAREATVQVRSRQSRPGPERKLLRAALKAEFLFRRCLPAVFFHEPELPTGLPDLVAVYLAKSVPSLCPSRLRLRDRHIRLLHHLYTVGTSTTSDLSRLLRIGKSELMHLLDDLQAAELLRAYGEVIKPRSLARAFAVKHIVAIEAKVSDWSTALMQAAANHWFASHSYILIPPSRVLERINQRAEELGVGVLVLEEGQLRVALEPRVRTIPASYGSWLFNEWALQRRPRP